MAALTEAEQAQVLSIVQCWLDTSESEYPGHRALGELATLLQLRRYAAPGMEPGGRFKKRKASDPNVEP